MDSGTTGPKWLIGTLIALLAAGGGIVALLNYIHPSTPSSGSSMSPDSRPPANSGDNAAKVTPTARICTIEGGVYNGDNDPPTAMPNVRINYIPNQGTANVYLTTTGPNGIFKGNCALVKSEEFPLRLELSSDRWQGITSKTPETVQETGKDNINIYVSLKDINNGIIRSNISRIRLSSIRQLNQ